MRKEMHPIDADNEQQSLLAGEDSQRPAPPSPACAARIKTWMRKPVLLKHDVQKATLWALKAGAHVV